MKRTLRVQRLARKEERVLIKKIFTLSIFSIILIVFILTLGISFLGKFADLLSSVLGGKDSQSSAQSSVDPPRLDQLSEATNSADFTVSGFARSGKVKIVINDEEVGEADVIDGKFSYENILLDDDLNEIKAKVVGENGKESDFSDVVEIVLDTKEPKLEVESPSGDQSFSGNNRIKVSGATEADSQVYANGFLASVNSDGKFEVSIPLVEGENTIEIKAIDDAGNVKVEKRKVGFRK